MTILSILIPTALGLGALGLAAFLWSLANGQYEDLDGAAHRILSDALPAPEGQMGHAHLTETAISRKAPPSQ